MKLGQLYGAKTVIIRFTQISHCSHLTNPGFNTLGELNTAIRLKQESTHLPKLRFRVGLSAHFVLTGTHLQHQPSSVGMGQQST